MRRVLLQVILVLLLFWIGYAERPQVGPYLIFPGKTDEMMLLWNFRTSSICTLRWGLNSDDLSNVLECSGEKSPRLRVASDIYYIGGYDYRITLDDLEPDAVYYYRLESDDDYQEGSFRTAPLDTAESIRFLAWADTQYAVSQTCPYADCCFGSTAQHVLEHIKEDPSLQTMILHAGDWVTDPLERSWKQFLTVRSNRELLSLVPMQGCIGNHDDIAHPRGDDSYLKYYPYPYINDHYWSFDYGPVHVVVVDQFAGMCAYPEAREFEQAEWIARDIEESDKPWIIVLFHMPQSNYDEYELADANCRLLRSALDPSKVDLLLTGHWHKHLFDDELGIPQLVMGSASDMHQQEGCMYYVFDVSGSQLIIECYAAGTLFERIEMEDRSSRK